MFAVFMVLLAALAGVFLVFLQVYHAQESEICYTCDCRDMPLWAEPQRLMVVISYVYLPVYVCVCLLAPISCNG